MMKGGVGGGGDEWEDVRERSERSEWLCREERREGKRCKIEGREEGRRGSSFEIEKMKPAPPLSQHHEISNLIRAITSLAIW